LLTGGSLRSAREERLRGLDVGLDGGDARLLRAEAELRLVQAVCSRVELLLCGLDLGRELGLAGLRDSEALTQGSKTTIRREIRLVARARSCSSFSSACARAAGWSIVRSRTTRI
jgi:hypothetical protein